MTKYPNVKNAHIVPETYLRNWTIDGKIAVLLIPDWVPLKKAGRELFVRYEQIALISRVA